MSGFATGLAASTGTRTVQKLSKNGIQGAWPFRCRRIVYTATPGAGSALVAATSEGSKTLSVVLFPRRVRVRPLKFFFCL
eukprot:scaffold2045_cov404-Prasinococcus_capsulatus_cf.AAC.35